MIIQIKMNTTGTQKFTLIAGSRNYSMNGIRIIWKNTEKTLVWGVLKILKGLYMDTRGGID